MLYFFMVKGLPMQVAPSPLTLKEKEKKEKNLSR
jgi:hypothetical protein